jgi:4-amino-4-deoxy-L-arabinose transferase-like glycosyltransferase
VRTSKDRLRTVPIAAWACALAVTLNAIAWSLITPAFQVPDETIHVAYVQSLAERHQPPGDPKQPIYSDDEANLIAGLAFDSVVGRPNDRGIWTTQQQRDLARRLSIPRDSANGGGPSNASSQPPLYYALQVVPYYLSPAHSLSQRLAAMRVMSSVIAGIAVFFIFLVLRECFPRSPWAWSAGALTAGFQPVFGFVAGGVNPDVLLLLASVLTIWATLQAFRVGLTTRTGLMIGLAVALGVLTKINFVALLPAVLVAIALLIWRSRNRRTATQGALAAAAAVAIPAVLYVLLNVLIWHRSVWAQSLQEQVQQVGTGRSALHPISVSEQLSYIWQLYLPRLPFMNDQFKYFPPWDSWLPAVVGVFGWLDTRWDPWVYVVGKVALLTLGAASLVGMLRARGALLRRWPQVVFLLMVPAGLAVEMGLFGIRYLRETGYAFEQGRYLLPLLPLYALAVVLASRAPGRKVAPVVGAGLVVLAVGHSLLAQLLVVSRFYG